MSKIEQARELILVSSKSQIDTILAKLKVSHAQYRKVYPDTPLTTGLAYDVMDAKDIDGLSNLDIREKWNLTRPQFHYVMFNDNAIKTEAPNIVRMRVEQALKAGKTQTRAALDNSVSQSYVHKIAKSLGLCPDRKRRVKLSSNQLHTIQQRMRDGESVDHLAQKYNVSRDTIYKRLRHN